jgi:hypothetical protein
MLSSNVGSGERESTAGKWSKPGVPHKGWICINIEDRGEADDVCEMCEAQAIRYVHYMQHQDYPEVLGAGCICAGKMADDDDGARRREADLRNAAQRRQRWLSRKWKESAKGNAYLNTDGFNIVIYPRWDPRTGRVWTFRITDRETERSIPSKRIFPKEDRAKLAAFDALIFLTQFRR